jgi:hypothetical protein
MAQETAVEWLINYCERENWSLPSDIEEIAKAMEKEQIVKAFNEGMLNSVDYFGNGVDEAEQYYIEKYNQ